MNDPRYALLARLDERRQAFEAFRRALEPLRTGSLEPVAGEAGLFAELEALTTEAFGVLRQLPGGDPDVLLPRLAELLDDVAWDVAEAVRPELDAKARRQDAVLGAARADVRAWDARLAELAKPVDGARVHGAPFAPLDARLWAAQRAVAAVRLALQDHQYAGLPALQQAAQQAVDALAADVQASEARVKRMCGLVQQADLLIMQVAAGADEYEYRVLLRSADRSAPRGINIIQDVRRLSRPDREWLVEMLGQLTGSIDDGRRAAHAARTITAADDGEGAAGHAGPNGTTGEHAAALASASGRDASQVLGVLGDFLFRMVIPEQVQAHLRGRDAWSCSITTNDLELPWELIRFDEGAGPADAAPPSDAGYLCLERSVSRMPLGGVFPPAPARRPADPNARRRMLLVHSDPEGNLPAAATEITAIEQALGGLVDITRVDPEDATNRRLNDLLTARPFDFVHYAGHAVFDVDHPGRSGLLLKGALLTAEKIRLLNRGGSLVFLNACESGTVARATEAQRAPYLLSKPEPVVGLASAFVYSGALGCVGSLWPVYDDAAADLAVEFYRRVLGGDPTGEALRGARRHVREKHPRELTWAGYVLYGDPTFRLTET